MSDEAFAQSLQRKIDLENRNRAFEESIPEGLKPPDGGIPVDKMAGLTLPAYQTWTNMDTGEDAANTGGWTAPNANWTTNSRQVAAS
jgi:hypothetical protein